MIGADATGLPFNSIIAILLENDHPSTPLVNAGAISACSMVQPVGNSDKKWDAIVQNVTELCGSAPQLIDELYKSETATNFNNRSIAWLLKNYNRIYDNPDMALGVMAVLPGVMGVSAFAPPLDEAGNSVKAQSAIKFIMNKLGLGVFNGDNVTITE